MPQPEKTEPAPLTFEQIAAPIWASRKKIVVLSLVVAAVTLGVNFLLPVYYLSTATILPETEKSKLSALGQFADIAQLAGVSIPGSEIARLYPTIIGSETVLGSVINKKYHTEKFRDSVTLIQYFELNEGTPEEDMAKALKKLRSLLSSSFDNRTSVVTLSLEMREPRLAADVLNAMIGELDGFMRSKRTTSASEQVKWIAVRLEQIQHDLRQSEEMLKDFRERNRRVLDSPQLSLEQARLTRNVEVNSAVFVELKKQYELAKLDEIKNLTIVNVLDPGNAPVKRERPKRATNTVIMFVVSLLCASAYFSVRQIYGEQINSKWRSVLGKGLPGKW